MLSPYAYTKERAYWASVILTDIEKGRTAQRAIQDVVTCLLLTGRFDPKEAFAEADACAYFAGVASEISTNL